MKSSDDRLHPVPGRSPSRPLARGGRWLSLSVIALAALRCGAPNPTPWAALPRGDGDLVTPRAVVCAPGRRFQPTDSGGWKFVARASVFCRVTRTPDGPLTLRLRPATADTEVELQWEGETVTPTRPAASGTPPGTPPDVLEMSVPPEELPSGLYELVLRPHPPGSPEPVPFDGLEIVLGGRTTPLRPEHREQSLRLLDFLLHGITGGGKEKWGGWLFDGSGRTTLELGDGGPVRLHLPVENLSSGPATFTAVATADAGETVSAEVAAGARDRLTLEVKRGDREIELAVSGRDEGGEEGSDHGLFLWRAPRIEPLSAGRERAFAPPPLVLITLDTTRRDALGVYGAPPEVTPVLDELARHATVYDRAATTTSWTLPSHSSMFTGLYPSHHGVGVRRADSLEPEVTLAELLRGRGYFSAGFAGGALCASRFGLARGFQIYRDPDAFETRGDRLTDYALALLEEHAGGGKGHGSSPLFLFVNYFDPHAPLQAPEELQARMGVPALRDALAGSPVWQRIAAGQKGWEEVVKEDGSVREAGRELARALYLAEVAFMDAQVGRLLDGLRRHGLYDEAMIVVVADHGELLGEGGYYGHAGRLDPELVEAPLLVKHPHQTEPERVTSLVSVMDVFPTLLEAAGLEPPASDGSPLPRVGEPGPDRSLVFFEEHESIVHPLPPDLRIAGHVYGIQGWRTRRVVWPQGQDCARREEEGWRAEPCRGDARETLARIQQVLGKPQTESSDQGRGMSEQDREALEALGYL